MAFDHAREMAPTSPLVDVGLVQVYLAQRNYDQAVAAAKALKARGARGANFLFWQSSAYAAQGDKAKALATMQEALNAGYRDFAAIDASPYFSSLRSDPRFQQLIQRYRK